MSQVITREQRQKANLYRQRRQKLLAQKRTLTEGGFQSWKELEKESGRFSTGILADWTSLMSLPLNIKREEIRRLYREGEKFVSVVVGTSHKRKGWTLGMRKLANWIRGDVKPRYGNHLTVLGEFQHDDLLTVIAIGRRLYQGNNVPAIYFYKYKYTPPRQWRTDGDFWGEWVLNRYQCIAHIFLDIMAASLRLTRAYVTRGAWEKIVQRQGGGRKIAPSGFCLIPNGHIIFGFQTRGGKTDPVHCLVMARRLYERKKRQVEFERLSRYIAIVEQPDWIKFCDAFLQAIHYVEDHIWFQGHGKSPVEVSKHMGYLVERAHARWRQKRSILQQFLAIHPHWWKKKQSRFEVQPTPFQDDWLSLFDTSDPVEAWTFRQRRRASVAAGEETSSLLSKATPPSGKQSSIVSTNSETDSSSK